MCSFIKRSMGGMDDPDECRHILESLSGRVLHPIWFICDTGLSSAKVLHTGVIELLELLYRPILPAVLSAVGLEAKKD